MWLIIHYDLKSIGLQSIESNFTVSVIQCSGEYELTYNATLNGHACQYYSGNDDVGTCEEDRSILILTVRLLCYFNSTVVLYCMCNV